MPAGLSSGDVTASGLTLTWNAVSAPAGCGVTYTIFKNGVELKTVSDTSVRVSNLEALTRYSFTVNASNSVGSSALSRALSVTTRELTTAGIFRRPVLSRAYEQRAWVMQDRESVATMANALAELHPTYVSGLVYVKNGTEVTQEMIDNYQAIKTAVLGNYPNAKFDLEISLNPNPPSPALPFENANALVQFMEALDNQFHPDAWNFDFYSNARQQHPDWIQAAVRYAHARGQLVGGNVFDSTVPEGSDFVSFVDSATTDGSSEFGFDYSRDRVARLRQSSPSTPILGHLQSNAQNGLETESNVYTHIWSEAKRAAYLTHWASTQGSVGFQFMYPVFYPLYPGAQAFDPLQDLAPDNTTLFQKINQLMHTYNILW